MKKLLIANRGEIACRVAKTAQNMGIEVLGVFTPKDIQALHARRTDRSFQVDDYLNYQGILQIAQENQVDAIHPGYGFLSENATFAEACQQAGITFVGPPVEAITAMGSKCASKDIMIATGVSVTPGFHGDTQPEVLFQEAKKIGFPVMLKAVMGGGGKGMRIVHQEKDFFSELASCQAESRNAFGDDAVLVEKYVINPRHIEFQVFGDHHGNYLHLYERDCSVQRRHQKILEESPAPNFPEALREKMAQQAVMAAAAVNYVGAGTVEFMLDPTTSEFYFMEMNTRLQVEHPVTEMVTGYDLVQWQLEVADGLPLPVTQSQIKQVGYAIEARVYAEDPANDFLPSPGTCHHLKYPEESSEVRVDTGIAQGDTISPYYDPMISKVITSGSTREKAINRLIQTLHSTTIRGSLKCNLEFLANLADHPKFRSGEVHTGFLEEHTVETQLSPSEVDYALNALRLRPGEPWDNFGISQLLTFEDQQEVLISQNEITVNGNKYQIVSQDEILSPQGELLSKSAHRLFLKKETFSAEAQQGDALAPMAGMVKKTVVSLGDTVKAGDTMVIMEAMKMEHKILAPKDGIVAEVRATTGEFVQGKSLLVVIQDA